MGIKLVKIRRGEKLNNIEVERTLQLRSLVIELVKAGKLICPMSDQEEEYEAERLDSETSAEFSRLSRGARMNHRLLIQDEQIYRAMDTFCQGRDEIILPWRIVEPAKQRRPSITAETMVEFARVKNPKYRMLLILAASTGCRIGELLGLEIKDLLDELTTVRVIQQAKGTKLTRELKTPNSARFVDISPEVAALLREFLAGRTDGLVFASRTGKPLNPSNICNRVIHPLLKKKGLPVGGSHIFRRFRMTWLRENSVPADIERFWLGHGNRTVGDDYSMLKKNLKFRKEIAAKIGVGFEFPGSILVSVVPNVPKTAAGEANEVLV